MVRVVSKEEARWRIEEKIMLDPDIRASSLTVFADAIEAAARFGPRRWAVTVEDEENKVRLHAGHIIVCTLCHFRPDFTQGCVWLALDKALLESSAGIQKLLDDSEDWQWSPPRERYHSYKDIQSRNGYYHPTGNYRGFWERIEPLHFESIREAATGRKMDPKTPARHQSGVIKYLSEVLGRSLPDRR